MAASIARSESKESAGHASSAYFSLHKGSKDASFIHLIDILEHVNENLSVEIKAKLRLGDYSTQGRLYGHSVLIHGDAPSEVNYPAKVKKKNDSSVALASQKNRPLTYMRMRTAFYPTDFVKTNHRYIAVSGLGEEYAGASAQSEAQGGNVRPLPSPFESPEAASEERDTMYKSYRSYETKFDLLQEDEGRKKHYLREEKRWQKVKEIADAVGRRNRIVVHSHAIHPAKINHIREVAMYPARDGQDDWSMLLAEIVRTCVDKLMNPHALQLAYNTCMRRLQPLFSSVKKYLEKYDSKAGAQFKLFCSDKTSDHSLKGLLQESTLLLYRNYATMACVGFEARNRIIAQHRPRDEFDHDIMDELVSLLRVDVPSIRKIGVLALGHVHHSAIFQVSQKLLDSEAFMRNTNHKDKKREFIYEMRRSDILQIYRLFSETLRERFDILNSDRRLPEKFKSVIKFAHQTLSASNTRWDLAEMRINFVILLQNFQNVWNENAPIAPSHEADIQPLFADRDRPFDENERKGLFKSVTDWSGYGVGAKSYVERQRRSFHIEMSKPKKDTPVVRLRNVFMAQLKIVSMYSLGTVASLLIGPCFDKTLLDASQAYQELLRNSYLYTFDDKYKGINRHPPEASVVLPWIEAVLQSRDKDVNGAGYEALENFLKGDRALLVEYLRRCYSCNTGVGKLYFTSLGHLVIAREVEMDLPTLIHLVIYQLGDRSNEVRGLALKLAEAIEVAYEDKMSVKCGPCRTILGSELPDIYTQVQYAISERFAAEFSRYANEFLLEMSTRIHLISHVGNQRNMLRYSKPWAQYVHLALRSDLLNPDIDVPTEVYPPEFVENNKQRGRCSTQYAISNRFVNRLAVNYSKQTLDDVLRPISKKAPTFEPSAPPHPPRIHRGHRRGDYDLSDDETVDLSVDNSSRGASSDRKRDRDVDYISDVSGFTQNSVVAVPNQQQYIPKGEEHVPPGSPMYHEYEGSVVGRLSTPSTLVHMRVVNALMRLTIDFADIFPSEVGDMWQVAGNAPLRIWKPQYSHGVELVDSPNQLNDRLCEVTPNHGVYFILKALLSDIDRFTIKQKTCNSPPHPEFMSACKRIAVYLSRRCPSDVLRCLTDIMNENKMDVLHVSPLTPPRETASNGESPPPPIPPKGKPQAAGNDNKDNSQLASHAKTNVPIVGEGYYAMMLLVGVVYEMDFSKSTVRDCEDLSLLFHIGILGLNHHVRFIRHQCRRLLGNILHSMAFRHPPCAEYDGMFDLGEYEEHVKAEEEELRSAARTFMESRLHLALIDINGASSVSAMVHGGANQAVTTVSTVLLQSNGKPEWLQHDDIKPVVTEIVDILKKADTLYHQKTNAVQLAMKMSRLKSSMHLPHCEFDVNVIRKHWSSIALGYRSCDNNRWATRSLRVYRVLCDDLELEDFEILIECLRSMSDASHPDHKSALMKEIVLTLHDMVSQLTSFKKDVTVYVMWSILEELHHATPAFVECLHLLEKITSTKIDLEDEEVKSLVNDEYAARRVDLWSPPFNGVQPVVSRGLASDSIECQLESLWYIGTITINNFEDFIHMADNDIRYHLNTIVQLPLLALFTSRYRPRPDFLDVHASDLRDVMDFFGSPGLHGVLTQYVENGFSSGTNFLRACIEPLVKLVPTQNLMECCTVLGHMLASPEFYLSSKQKKAIRSQQNRVIGWNDVGKEHPLYPPAYATEDDAKWMRKYAFDDRSLHKHLEKLGMEQERKDAGEEGEHVIYFDGGQRSLEDDRADILEDDGRLDDPDWIHYQLQRYIFLLLELILERVEPNADCTATMDFIFDRSMKLLHTPMMKQAIHLLEVALAKSPSDKKPPTLPPRVKAAATQVNQLLENSKVPLITASPSDIDDISLHSGLSNLDSDRSRMDRHHYQDGGDHKDREEKDYESPGHHHGHGMGRGGHHRGQSRRVPPLPTVDEDLDNDSDHSRRQSGESFHHSHGRNDSGASAPPAEKPRKKKETYSYTMGGGQKNKPLHERQQEEAFAQQELALEAQRQIQKKKARKAWKNTFTSIDDARDRVRQKRMAAATAQCITHSRPKKPPIVMAHQKRGHSRERQQRRESQKKKKEKEKRRKSQERYPANPLRPKLDINVNINGVPVEDADGKKKKDKKKEEEKKVEKKPGHGTLQRMFVIGTNVVKSLMGGGGAAAKAKENDEPNEEARQKREEERRKEVRERNVDLQELDLDVDDARRESPRLFADFSESDSDAPTVGHRSSCSSDSESDYNTPREDEEFSDDSRIGPHINVHRGGMRDRAFSDVFSDTDF